MWALVEPNLSKDEDHLLGYNLRLLYVLIDTII